MMKKKITIKKEILELEERKRLLEWQKRRGYANRFQRKWSLANMSISMLIEFLEDHLKTDWAILFGKDLAFVEISGLKGLFGKTPDNRDGELCDGLWVVVKKELQKKDYEN